uniref:cilia- and flagella-associated protein 65-like n=1 Tax=Ictidomys tridecemlineatus TaxID=43179 RepID=UPI001A9E0DC5|nr:cilia- and flagella-associated protein 65-like [Ictidomys tridecemlineatus]
MIGELAPEETAPFVVTLKTSVHASFYSVDLICKVYRQELMKQYHKELQEWTDEKVRQEAEFTITDRKVKKRAYCTACEPMRRYKTLPPIKNKQSLNWPASWNLKITKEETSWPCPQPPATGMLCLSLSARAHPTDYFLDNFFSEFSCHFLHSYGQLPPWLIHPIPAWWLAQATQIVMACPRELPERKTPREESEASEEEFPNKGTLVYKQKKQLLVDCLTNIIRGMLEDKNFHKAVDQILVEKVPYFCQFWNEQSARFMVQKSNLYLVPNLSPPSSTCEEEKSKEQEKDRQGLGEEDKRGLGEEDKRGLGEEDKPGLGEEDKQGLPAFANLQEALLENMIQNILVEASRGEVVLTSRPRIIALPPLSVPRMPTLDPLLPTQQEEVTVPVAPPPPDSLLATVPSLSDMPT